MSRNIAIIVISAFAGWVLMPFAGIVIYTICGIAAVGAFVGAYAIIADIEANRHERYMQRMNPQMNVKPAEDVPQIEWRY